MNGKLHAAMKRFSAHRINWSSALAGMLLILATSVAGRTASADDPPATTKPSLPEPGLPQLKSKQPTAKPGAAKSTAKTAAPAKPNGPQPRSIAGDLLDDQPASDLDNQLLDGPPAAKQPTGKQPPAKSTPNDPGTPPADLDAPPVVPGPVLSGNGNDPLFRIGEQMHAIEHRLEAPRAGDTETPALQTQIVDALAQLIEQLEEQQNSQQPSPGSKSPPSGSSTERKSVRQPGAPAPSPAANPGDNRPAKESTERQGKNEVHAPSADEIRGLMKDVWGQLPAREREQMLQSPPEQFLPKYELLLEKYYKRLADEQQHQP